MKKIPIKFDKIPVLYDTIWVCQYRLRNINQQSLNDIFDLFLYVERFLLIYRGMSFHKKENGYEKNAKKNQFHSMSVIASVTALFR